MFDRGKVQVRTLHDTQTNQVCQQRGTWGVAFGERMGPTARTRRGLDFGGPNGMGQIRVRTGS